MRTPDNSLELGFWTGRNLFFFFLRDFIFQNNATTYKPFRNISAHGDPTWK